MYEDFHAVERWSKQRVHCAYQALVVAIATRHADAVDIKFAVDGRPAWVSLPCMLWVEFQRLTGNALTDPLAVETAGHYLKQAIESGMEGGREMYALTVDEALEHLNHVLEAAGSIPAAPLTPRRG